MREEQQRDHRDELDLILDNALAKYAAVEPRSGLEERILSHLNSPGTIATGVAWWRWAGTFAAAFVVMILVLWGVEKYNPQRMARRPAGSQEQTPSQVVTNHAPVIPVRPIAPVRVRTARKHTSTQPVVVAAGPKLDQFPSPQPLSEEELALARYVHSFPKEATMIAQTQEEFDLEAQREMNDAGSQNRLSNFVQPER